MVTATAGGAVLSVGGGAPRFPAADAASPRVVIFNIGSAADLAWAGEQGLPAALVSVADAVRHYLEPLATTADDAAAILAARPGTLFRYVGPADGRGFAQRPQPNRACRVLIKAAKRGGTDVHGEARLSHALVSSVANMSDAGFRKYVLALKLEEPARFAPLLLGVAVFDLFGEGASGAPRYPALAWRSPHAAADAMITTFRQGVEAGSLWRLLDVGSGRGDLPGEETLQSLFEFVFTALSGQFDVSVDPQANHGAGEVDLCVSRGSADACCIELKLATHARLVHGLTKQLPAYMRSRGTTHGRYVVLCRTDGPSPHEVEARLEAARSGLDDHLDVAVVVVDARARPSASRL